MSESGPGADHAVDQIGSRTLHALWCERVEMWADKTWLVFEDQSGAVREYTYRQFDAEVTALSRGLQDHGVGAGDGVVLHTRNCPEFVMAWFAIAQLGAVIVPSNIANTAPELAYIIDRAHARVVISSAEFVDTVRAAAGDLTALITVGAGAAVEGTRRFEDVVAAGRAAGAPTPPEVLTLDSDLQILFTSGTTALPKGVVATHANALWAGLGAATGLGLEPEDRCMTALPLFHVNAQAVTVLATLTAGGTVVLQEVFRPERYLDQLRRHRVTVTSVVAAQAKGLLAQPPAEDDDRHLLRRVGFAINIDDDDKETFEKRFGVRLVNIYGLSEAMAIVSMSPLHGPQRWPSVGMPAMGRRVRIVDVDLTALPPREIGEIQVYGVPGRTVMKRYYDDPAATDAAIIDGWVRTGDFGYLDEAGYLYFYERQKDVIKCSGQNVSASEVEHVLAQHPAVVEAAVIGVSSERRGETVKAFLVLEPGASVTLEEIVEHCRQLLSRYKIPEFVEVIPELPKTSIGKIAKSELRSRS